MYSAFNLAGAGGLWVTRHGWLRPVYEFTDGQFCYGKLAYQGFIRRSVLAETATNSLLFEFSGFFNHKVKISTVAQDDIGILQLNLFGRATLTMNNGFEAVFYRKTFWPRLFCWGTTNNEELVTFQHHIFSAKKINIGIHPNVVKSDIAPLICCLGTHLIILRQRRKSAAH